MKLTSDISTTEYLGLKIRSLRYTGWEANQITEISIPWGAENPNSFDLIAYAQWQDEVMFGHHSLLKIP